MRKLVWLVLGFSAGCAAGIWLLSGLALALLSVGCLAIGFLLIALRKFGRGVKLAGVIFLGCFAGSLWLHIYDIHCLSVPRSYDRVTLTAMLEAADYGYVSGNGYGSAVDCEITLEGKDYSVKCYLDETEPLKPGDRIYGSFQLRYTGIWGQESPTYHQGKGILLLAYPVEDIRVYRVPQVPGRYFSAELRENITGLLERVFPQRTRGFAAALLLGNSENLSVSDDTTFQVSGIRHIIAVSGLHVSVLFAMLQFLLRKRRILSGLIGLPVLVLFAAVAGFTPSIIRACVMHGIMILSRMIKKEYDPPSALAFAVLVILLWNPLALTAVGFQLSVGCIVGIFLFAAPIAEFLRKRSFLGYPWKNRFLASVFRGTTQSLSITLGTMVMTAPLTAIYFGSISLISVFTNLLSLWLVSLSFYGIVFCVVLGAVWLPASTVLAWLVSVPMQAVLSVAHFLAEIPFASVGMDNLYIGAWVFFTYVLLALFFLMGRKYPWILMGCVLASLVGCLTLSKLETATERFRVTVLDVEQGQCVILQSGGHCYLVDCGGDYASSAAAMAAQNLRSQGIGRVDGMILTHYDTDHAGGALSFLAQIPAGLLYVPDASDDNGIPEQLQAQYGGQMLEVTEERLLRCGDATVRIFPGENPESGNESSLCILFQIDNCDILITGDRNQEGERALLEACALPDIEVLVVGHHGAGTSTGYPLLYAARPDVAVISVGEDNPYKHPSADTLDRLNLFHCMILRTDQHGTITFRG